MRRLILAAFAGLLFCFTATAQISGICNIGDPGLCAPPSAGSAGTPFTLDGTPVTAQTTSGSVAMPAFSTTFGSDVNYCAVLTNGGPVTGVTDTAGNTYTPVRARANDGAAADTVELWSAKATAIQSGNVITIATTSSSFFSAACFAFSGAHFASPYDANVAIPNAVNGNASLCTWTTTSTNDILIGIARSTIANPTPGAGFTQIAVTGGFVLIQYELVSATQPGTLFAFGTGGNAGGSVCDAIIKGP